MNILILSASTGGGHMASSKALKNFIETHNKDANVRVIDTIKYINPTLNKVVSGGYTTLAKEFPLVYKRLYKLTDQKRKLTSMVGKMNLIFSKKLVPLINDFKPDIIITTHPFSTEMISLLKERKKIDIPLMCIMTDYIAHNTWIKPRVDAYIVASETMKNEMIDRGISDKKVYPYGIPVDKKFLEEFDKTKIMHEVGFKEGKTTILVMAGSFGVKNISTIYDEISNIPLDIQIIVITGNNKKLFDELSYKVEVSNKKTELIEFTTEVNKFMKISDVIITKPGGVTTSEALSCNLPMIVFDAIPGQEEGNARFLIENNMAISIGNGSKCKDEVNKLLKDKDKLKDMKNKCLAFDKSKCNENILNLIEKLSKNN